MDKSSYKINNNVLIINEGITEIENCAFRNQKLDIVILPNSLKVIGDMAFENCLIKKLIINGNLTKIGVLAFQNNKIEDKLIVNCLEICEAAFLNNMITMVEVPENAWLKKQAFDNNVRIIRKKEEQLERKR